MKSLYIVGLGALGSHLTLFSRELGAAITSIDGDRVESKNVASQFHVKMRQGNNKAKALSSTMSALFSKRIVAVSTMVRENNAALLLNGADLVADCTDNKEARDLIQKICIGNKIPCVHGCLDADSTMARIIWTDFFSSDEEDAKDQATCEDGRHLPFYGMVGAMMAYVIGQFFTYGIKESMQIIAAGKIIKLHTAR